MAAPSTKFIWDDQSDINTDSASTVNIDRPVYMAVFSADKGPEEFQNGVDSSNFFKLYGSTPNYFKHGQTLIQAANIVNEGGRLFCKRVVADDAKLANIAVIARVNKIKAQKVDENGNPVYTNASGQETNNPNGTTPVMIQNAQITYELKVADIEGNNVDNFAQAIYQDYHHTSNLGNDDTYPLFIITDNGRGVSNKKIRIYADTTEKRPVDYVKYVLVVMEGNETLETLRFTLNPDTTYDDANMGLQTVVSQNSSNIRCRIFEDEIKQFANNVAYIAQVPIQSTSEYAEASTATQEDIMNVDILFGYDYYGNALKNITYGTESVNLTTSAGISLLNGSNGDFGDCPIEADTYTAKVLQVFNGSYSDEIYDLDNNRIDVIFDCNWPEVIKRAIEDLVSFREDCFYFRDMGTGLTTWEAIKDENDKATKNKFCASYSNSWDIIEPYSKKQITVTSTYNLANKFVNHYLNGVNRPFCGIAYGITFNNEVLDGTINFKPKNTPQKDQKQLFDDERINYAAYYNGVLTMDTEYTSQKRYTQLSWLNNVLMVQKLIRDIRARCPINRYKFLDGGTELSKYKADVESILSEHSSDYKSISIKYVEDDYYTYNKIFYAIIVVQFKNFIQSEIFKLTVIK